jgi:hypothetical protein
MNDENITTQIVNKEKGKEITWIRWSDEVEQILKKTRTRYCIQWPETGRNGGGLCWKLRSTTDCM